ncbi:hypothetical protein PG994_013516 [Apiospora phragmitis]|uniref:Uncharacterized protein n=1 Tax=Apiospora phragmitis TaxID=2905665 RepID=A0ABR1T8U6_9PEZI
MGSRSHSGLAGGAGSSDASSSSDGEDGNHDDDHDIEVDTVTNNDGVTSFALVGISTVTNGGSSMGAAGSTRGMKAWAFTDGSEGSSEGSEMVPRSKDSAPDRERQPARARRTSRKEKAPRQYQQQNVRLQ